MEKNYSRVILKEVKYPDISFKLERFMDEYGKEFYKESTFNIKKNRNGKVQYRFTYDGTDETMFSFFNTFAYYLDYKGNIDDDLKHFTKLPIFEDDEVDNYFLQFYDKNDTKITIESDVEKMNFNIYLSDGAIASNMDYYDDNIVEAFASFKVHRGL